MDKRTRALSVAAVSTTVMLAGCCSKSPEVLATSSAASAAVANLSNIDMTEHVKAALTESESLKGFDINVATLKGDVRLIGMLDNQAQIDEALRMARASDGAHTNHDELTIEK